MRAVAMHCNLGTSCIQRHPQTFFQEPTSPTTFNSIPSSTHLSPSITLCPHLRRTPHPRQRIILDPVLHALAILTPPRLRLRLRLGFLSSKRLGRSGAVSRSAHQRLVDCLTRDGLFDSLRNSEVVNVQRRNGDRHRHPQSQRRGPSMDVVRGFASRVDQDIRPCVCSQRCHRGQCQSHGSRNGIPWAMRLV